MNLKGTVTFIWIFTIWKEHFVCSSDLFRTKLYCAGYNTFTHLIHSINFHFEWIKIYCVGFHIREMSMRGRWKSWFIELFLSLTVGWATGTRMITILFYNDSVQFSTFFTSWQIVAFEYSEVLASLKYYVSLWLCFAQSETELKASIWKSPSLLRITYIDSTAEFCIFVEWSTSTTATLVGIVWKTIATTNLLCLKFN